MKYIKTHEGFFNKTINLKPYEDQISDFFYSLIDLSYGYKKIVRDQYISYSFKIASQEYRRKTKRGAEPISIYGFWDGEKVSCSDNEYTIVRNKEKLYRIPWYKYIFILIYHLYLLRKRKINRNRKIKDGTLIPLKKKN